MPAELNIPEGFRVEETRDVVLDDTKLIEVYWLKTAAARRCMQLNNDRFLLLYRWELEKLDKATRKRAGWRWYYRWLVVPYQNKLVRIDD